MGRSRLSLAQTLILFVAEGFGTGRFPVAPGTVGTLVGFGWVYLLLRPGNLWFYLAGMVFGYFAAVWIGGRGEEISGRKDPGSIVIDEIAALPLAFLGAVVFFSREFQTPPFAQFLSGRNAWLLVVAFAGFRFFDVVKPGVIGRSQRLPGGWGLVTDDFLAAAPVGLLTYLVARLL